MLFSWLLVYGWFLVIHISAPRSSPQRHLLWLLRPKRLLRHFLSHHPILIVCAALIFSFISCLPRPPSVWQLHRTTDFNRLAHCLPTVPGTVPGIWWVFNKYSLNYLLSNYSVFHCIVLNNPKCTHSYSVLTKGWWEAWKLNHMYKVTRF